MLISGIVGVLGGAAIGALIAWAICEFTEWLDDPKLPVAVFGIVGAVVGGLVGYYGI